MAALGTRELKCAEEERTRSSGEEEEVKKNDKMSDIYHSKRVRKKWGGGAAQQAERPSPSVAGNAQPPENLQMDSCTSTCNAVHKPQT